MKILLQLIPVLFIINISYPQVELKATMGINFLSMPSVQDYINQSNFSPPNEELGSFNSAVIFTGEAGYFINPNFQLSLEFGYQIYSFTNVGDGGKYEMVYNLFLPSILSYYVINGSGYNFKFGGGAGPRITDVDESLPGTGSTVNFSSMGFGLLFRIEGNTVLGGDLYANVGADLSYDLNGEPDNTNGEKLENKIQEESVNFNAFTLGIRLGISYLIGMND